MDLSNLSAIVADVTVPYGWRLKAFDRNGTLFLQVACDSDRCNVTNAETSWSGRKWFVSPHSCESEVVQTCFKAVLTAAEHETREKFLYRGAMIFGPHMDVNALLEIAHRVQTRTPGGH